MNMLSRKILYLLLIFVCCNSCHTKVNNIEVLVESVYSNQQPSGEELGMWLIVYKIRIQNNTDSTVRLSANFFVPPDRENANPKTFAVFEDDTIELLCRKRQIEIKGHSCEAYRFHPDFTKLERLYYDKYENTYPVFQDYLSHVADKAEIIMVFNKDDTVKLRSNKRIEFLGDPYENAEWIF